MWEERTVGGMTTMTTTQAEVRAERTAERLRAAGWTVTIDTSNEAASLYDDGTEMIPAYRLVFLAARKGTFDGTLDAAWRTYTSGHRTTKYGGGTRRPFTGRSQKLRSERDLHLAVKTLGG
jgi:hypothetical protein